jgi:hypothetical protein
MEHATAGRAHSHLTDDGDFLAMPPLLFFSPERCGVWLRWLLAVWLCKSS